MSTSAAGEAAQPSPPSTSAAGEAAQPSPPSRRRTWATSSSSTGRRTGYARTPARRRRPSAAQPGPKSLSAASWFFKDVSGGLLLAGVLTYGLLHLAYEEFYNSFGVSLDELGIGYPQLLSQGAAGFAVLLLFSLITVGASVFIWGAVTSEVWAGMSGSETLKRLLDFLRSPSRRWVWVISGAALVICVRIWGPAWLLLILILVFALVGLVPILRRAYARGGSSSSLASASPAAASRRLTVAILATTIIAVLGAGVTLIAAAHGDAAMIKKGEVPVSGLPVSISSWGARDAVLIPLTPAADKAYASVAGHKLMYLGAGQNRFILFDVDKQRTIRIPSRDLVVSTEP